MLEISCLCVCDGARLAGQQASTAACARLGPMGLGQVRVSECEMALERHPCFPAFFIRLCAFLSLLETVTW